jgi:hypothetical protein
VPQARTVNGSVGKHVVICDFTALWAGQNARPAAVSAAQVVRDMARLL